MNKEENNFKLLDTFLKKKLIIDLPLCTVLLEDKEFPWILLIPRRENVLQINQLNKMDRMLLIEEIALCSDVMQDLFPTDRLNVATIGNKSPQLHVHIICRTCSDKYWPETIWGKPMERLSSEKQDELAQKIQSALALKI